MSVRGAHYTQLSFIKQFTFPLQLPVFAPNTEATVTNSCLISLSISRKDTPTVVLIKSYAAESEGLILWSTIRGVLEIQPSGITIVTRFWILYSFSITETICYFFNELFVTIDF